MGDSLSRLNMTVCWLSHSIWVVGCQSSYLQTFKETQESIPSAYVAWRAGTTNRVVVPARQATNRFLGSLKGLQIRAQNIKFVPRHSYWSFPLVNGIEKSRLLVVTIYRIWLSYFIRTVLIEMQRVEKEWVGMYRKHSGKMTSPQEKGLWATYSCKHSLIFDVGIVLQHSFMGQ